jgi:uncharacterized repeat protein (TIGR04044 family)
MAAPAMRICIARLPPAGATDTANRASIGCASYTMPAVNSPLHQKGDYLVDYEEKVFEDVKAKPGEKALVTFHTVAFEGSIGFVNLLQATRLHAQRLRDLDPALRPRRHARRAARLSEARRRSFPGPSELQQQLVKFMAEGGKVYACRFALQALYGHGEPSLIPGIRPISPLDVLDLSCCIARTTPSCCTPGRSEHGRLSRG